MCLLCSCGRGVLQGAVAGMQRGPFPPYSLLPLRSHGLSAGQVAAIDLWLGARGSTSEQREAFNNVRHGYSSLIMNAPVPRPGHDLSLPRSFCFPRHCGSHKLLPLPPVVHVLVESLACRIWGISGGWGCERDQAAGADVCVCQRGGRGRRGPDGALCSCGGLHPRAQQDGEAGPGSELGFGCLSLQGGWRLAGQCRTRFPPTSLVPAVLSMATGTRGSLLCVAAGSCLIPASVGVGDREGTWTSLSLRR